jgi:PAS domain S-box-containing protein
MNDSVDPDPTLPRGDAGASLGSPREQLALATELVGLAMSRYDLVTQRVRFNDRAFAVVGMTPTPDFSLSVEDVRALAHPDDLERWQQDTRELLAGTQPSEVTIRFRHTDGSWRTTLIRRAVERDAQGMPVAVLGISVDITRQIEASRRAAELSQRLALATAAAGIAVWEVDLASKAAHWDAQMYRLHGRDPAHGPLSFADWLEHYVHPDDRASVQARAADVIDGSAIGFESEFRIVRSDGTVRWLFDRAHLNRDGAGKRVLGVMMDITERMQTRDALRQASERVALAARGVGIGTWENDLTTGETLWDEQMFRLRELPPSKRALNQNERDALVHPDDLPRVQRSLDASLAAGGATHEFRVRLPGGQWRWLASRSVVVRDASGRALRQIGMNWDITQAKEAELAVRERAVAQQKNRAKSEFLARMSHELRTPLNAVLGFTELMLTDGRTGDEATRRKRLEHIRAAGRHLLALINDVLDLSRMESDQAVFEHERIRVAPLVRDTLPLVEALARERGVQLYSGSLRGSVQGDPTRLRQVLLNLLTNAIKYNRAGGAVFVEALDEGDTLRLSVRDTGRGMTAAQLAQLFQPFNRLGVQREGIEGTGIGLTIAQTIVERLGGHIDVSSDAGVGSTFAVVLPRGDDTTVSVPPEALQPIGHSGQQRGVLLYIEDNPVNTLIVQELLAQRSGIEFHAASDGESGVRRAIELRPDLVLIDMQLPDFDGMEVLRRLRADAATASVRCIALSANAMPEDISRALAAGFSDYWTKPIDFTAFMRAIDLLFAARGR